MRKNKTAEHVKMHTKWKNTPQSTYISTKLVHAYQNTRIFSFLQTGFQWRPQMNGKTHTTVRAATAYRHKPLVKFQFLTELYVFYWILQRLVADKKQR